MRPLSNLGEIAVLHVPLDGFFDAFAERHFRQAPRSTRASTRAAPMNDAPPVTRTRLLSQDIRLLHGSVPARQFLLVVQLFRLRGVDAKTDDPCSIRCIAVQ